MSVAGFSFLSVRTPKLQIFLMRSDASTNNGLASCLLLGAPRIQIWIEFDYFRAGTSWRHPGAHFFKSSRFVLRGNARRCRRG